MPEARKFTPPPGWSTNLEIVQRALCRADGHACGCQPGACCLGQALYSDQARQVVEDLAAASRLISPEIER